MKTNSQQTPEANAGGGFFKSVWADYSAVRARTRGVFRGTVALQREMASSGRRSMLLDETMSMVKTAMRVRPNEARRKDDFEVSAKRQGLSNEWLARQMQHHKWAHLFLYIAGAAMLLYAYWMMQTVSAFMGTGIACMSLALFINGYIHGFRAWQIEHRSLISFAEAIRTPGTYLVL